MAAEFPKVMTALLARAEIANYFKVINRHRVDVPTYAGPMPMLQVYVRGDVGREPAGSGKFIRIARYTMVAAARMEPGKKQDELVGELVDAVEQAAENLVYDVAGVMANVRLDDWSSDDNYGPKAGDRVWVDFPVEIRVKPA